MSSLRVPALRTVNLVTSLPQFQSRMLSVQGSVAVQKLRAVLEGYRALNYTQELPSRFKKEIFRAAVQEPEGNHIALAGMTRVLSNIGASDRVSPLEMQIIFQELGNEMGQIPVQRMAQIF